MQMKGVKVKTVEMKSWMEMNLMEMESERAFLSLWGSEVAHRI